MKKVRKLDDRGEGNQNGWDYGKRKSQKELAQVEKEGECRNEGNSGIYQSRKEAR